LFKNVPNSRYFDTDYWEYQKIRKLKKTRQLRSNHKMSHYNEIILGLALGGTLLWWWKTTEDEKQRKKEQEHRQYIENLARSLDFEVIKGLNNTDFNLLVSLLSSVQALQIREQKRAYEERIRLEAEERERHAAIERERLRLERERIRHEQEIEEKRRRQVRMMEMAESFDTDMIKHLNDLDFNELLKHLDSNRIAVASAVRSSYQAELRLKRETDALRAESERLRLERDRLRYEREREKERDLSSALLLANKEFDYQRGFDKGLVDGSIGNHAANSWDWFFTPSEYKQGYEVGYNKSRHSLHQKDLKVVLVSGVSDINNRQTDVSRQINNLSNKIDKATQNVEKLGSELRDKLNEQNHEQVHVDFTQVPYEVVDEEEDPEEQYEESEEDQKKDQDQDQDQESEQEKQMNLLDVMMHN
jgi:hypothetical protein